MTVSDTSTPAEVSGGAPPDARRARRLGRIGLLVNQRIGGAHGLQKRYLDNESLGRAEVAALRKGANRAPGELPEIWELTRVEVPDGAGDAPTREEIAVHTAMTLYAVHQQSRSECMFVPGRGLGRAAHELVGTDEENPSARARFNALVTSTTVAELRHHLRNLVSLLRSRGIALDHAMLADDIVRFQRPGGAKSVRLAWAREYASLPADGAVSAPGIDHDTTSTNHASTLEN